MQGMMTELDNEIYEKDQELGTPGKKMGDTADNFDHVL